MRIGVIGTGAIGSAVVAGLAGQGHAITVSERSAARSADLAARFADVSVADNQRVVDTSDIVILGLMVGDAAAVLGRLRFREDQRVISLMAGAPLDRVAGWVAPARAKAVMLPFPGIAQGGSPILAQGDVTIVQALFGARNTVFDLDGQTELDAYLCAQAVLSPVLRLVADAAGWLGARVGDPDRGEAFLRLLVGSSLLSGPCGPTLSALDTPGGYNQRLRDHMVAAGMSGDLERGLDALEQGT
ncbi:NAD(P)-binding domain-containing protein [Thalassococcus sp. CAU 1522]|uniref:NAD(P)-binding domain-containing protein n=1 Tax=Thalassococcus arenae TaxID=2851652 RepID=A0ABS6NCA7_9RHOB|nr:NAD(P)-binding domain-containing protein [Thalassococcus arenae]MBV2361608.1 NAD(P)-binding domain-containing protein [Thalassococcus arenae]